MIRNLWKNELENNSRPITAYLFSRAKIGDKQLPGDHLGIGGSHDPNRTGKLFVFNGNTQKQSVGGTTKIPANTWNHVVLVRDDDRVRVFLNGTLEIDAEGTLPLADAAVELANLAAALKEQSAAYVELVPADDCPFRYVAVVLAACRKANVEFTFKSRGE